MRRSSQGSGGTPHAPFAALVGFVALTAVLSVNFNLERLYRGAAVVACPRRTGSRSLLQRLYAWSLRLAGHARRALRRVPAARCIRRGRGAAYHDRATVSVLANMGMTPQLAAFGVCIAVGHPLAFVWVLAAEVVLVARARRAA